MTVQPTTNVTGLHEFEGEVWEQGSIHKIVARVMARPDAATFKFTGEMVRESKALWDWAEYVIDHYQGTFSLMVEFRTKQRLGRQMSENQLKVALNCLLNAWKQSLKTTRQAQVVRAAAPSDPIFDAPVDFAQVGQELVAERTYPTPAELKPVVAQTVKAPTVQIDQVPTDGTYTYVTGDGNYRVVRFNTPRTSDNQPGKVTWVSYQYGPDNDAEFAKCGRIQDNALTIWQKAYLKGDHKVALDNTQKADLVEAISFICNLDKDGLLKSGEAYALRSGNCFICGRTLTVPSSLSAGIGPVCAKRWGI